MSVIVTEPSPCLHVPEKMSWGEECYAPDQEGAGISQGLWRKQGVAVFLQTNLAVVHLLSGLLRHRLRTSRGYQRHMVFGGFGAASAHLVFETARKHKFRCSLQPVRTTEHTSTPVTSKILYGYLT